LREHERLVRVEDGIFFHQEAVHAARDIMIDHLRQEGRLESVKFKYLLDTSRRFAIPLLDYLDTLGITRRDGHTRYLKEP
jgi:selenocysteine-specific elongation factor